MPSTVTTAVIASTAATNSAIAAQRAREHEEACKTMLPSYEAKGATVEEMRVYADCVHTVHGTGEGLTGGEALLLKIAIVIVLISGVVGAWHGTKAPFSSFLDVVMYFVAYVLGAMAAMLVFAGLVAALHFLFS